MPWELNDVTSINAYVRSEMSERQRDGYFRRGVGCRQVNPGIFSQPGTANPAIAVMNHFSSNAIALISVDEFHLPR